MAGIPSLLSGNERLLLTELQDIKKLLAAIKLTTAGNEIYMQFPSPGQASITLGAHTVSTPYDIQIEKTLKYMSVDAPDGVIVSIYKDNAAWADYTESSGSIIFQGGVYFESVKVVVENTTDYSQKWSLKMVWG